MPTYPSVFAGTSIEPISTPAAFSTRNVVGPNPLAAISMPRAVTGLSGVMSMSSSPLAVSHVRAIAQVESRSHDIVEFTRPASPVVDRFAKIQAISGAAAIVHREHHEPSAREILVEGIGVVVVPQIMKAQQHLSAGASMEKDDRRLRLICGIRREKELAVDRQSVRPGEDHRLGFNQVIGWKVRRHGLGSHWRRRGRGV